MQHFLLAAAAASASRQKLLRQSIVVELTKAKTALFFVFTPVC